MPGPRRTRRARPARGPSGGCCSARSCPRDRDTDVIRLYVDPDPAVLDADKYEIGHNRQARELNAVAMRQAVGTGSQVHPDRIESRTAYRLKMGDKLSFGTYFNAFPASYWRRWTIVDEVRLTVRLQRHRRHRDRLPLHGQRPVTAGRQRHQRGVHGGVLLRPDPQAVRRRRLVLVRRGRRRRGLRGRVGGVDRRSAGGPCPARHRHDRHHHHEPPGLLREAAHPAR